VKSFKKFAKDKEQYENLQQKIPHQEDERWFIKKSSKKQAIFAP